MTFRKTFERAVEFLGDSQISGIPLSRFADDVRSTTLKLKHRAFVFADEKDKYNQTVTIISAMVARVPVIPLCDDYGEERNRQIKSQVESYHIPRGVAVILFTSGTSGEPKGVMLTWKGIRNNLAAIRGYMGDERRRILILRPLVHSAVFTGELLYGLLSGWDIEFWDNPILPTQISTCIAKRNISIVGMTPTLLKAFLRLHITPPVKDIIISGEPLSASDASLFVSNLPRCRFFSVYGLTENSPRVSALPFQDFATYKGSVGKPIGKTKLRIVRGELWVKSPSIMRGYFHQKKLTREKLKHGWLKTGDFAQMDKEGNLYILGRVDNMIIRCGMNIYPIEIESVLSRCEGINECVVYGKQDVSYGQKIAVDFVGAASETEVGNFALKNLPPYLIPNEYHRVDMIEKAPSGKIKRSISI